MMRGGRAGDTLQHNIHHGSHTQQKQNIWITFIQCWTNVEMFCVCWVCTNENNPGKSTYIMLVMYKYTIHFFFLHQVQFISRPRAQLQLVLRARTFITSLLRDRFSQIESYETTHTLMDIFLITSFYYIYTITYLYSIYYTVNLI